MCLSVALLLCPLPAVGESQLPVWGGRESRAWSEDIGNADDGVTGQYILTDSDDSIGVIFYPYLHYRTKKGATNFKKDRFGPWYSLYVKRFRYTLDNSFTIDIETHPALSSPRPKFGGATSAHSLSLPFAPDTLLVKAWLTNGALMTGGVRIANDKKPKLNFDARRDVELPEGIFRYHSDKLGKSSREQAAIRFRQHYPDNYSQLYDVVCVSSGEAGPFTHAEFKLSPDDNDSRREPIYARITFSSPVYSISAGFSALLPSSPLKRTESATRNASFSCTTITNKVISVTKSVDLLPPRKPFFD